MTIVKSLKLLKIEYGKLCSLDLFLAQLKEKAVCILLPLFRQNKKRDKRENLFNYIEERGIFYERNESRSKD